MATKARALARPHAAARVADEIEATSSSTVVKNSRFVGTPAAKQAAFVMTAALAAIQTKALRS